MKEINPEIKRFWEKRGEVSGPTLIDSWECYLGKLPIRQIVTIAHGNKYYYEKEWYTEEQMLKILKMKAFL